ncbi:hypothetical protein GS397_07115 [Sphingobium yanoikuyae]|uniref:Uncharacterized protein n=1 Tax=Sphingobium yanoikuyae TaxID=13690 RepID=A0A6P1GEN8_SPHYA|nr:hypothetical protein [Sphingobium yanoikuyae]QHD66840.1 hypothetical protein GS397_07115 [Sphingobium yanoikuyae]
MVEIIAVIISIATPFALIAYKHPIGFRRIYWPISVIGLAVFLGICLWSIAIVTAHGALRPFIKPDAIEAASNAIAAINTTSYWFLLNYLAFQAYFSILLWLPEILGIKEQQS